VVVEIAAGASEQAATWRARGLPSVEELADGLWSIPVPMPGTSARYVLSYAMRVADGLALVDSGWHSEAAWQALTEGIAATGHQPRHVRTVLITHAHADHIGLAGRFREANGARVVLHSVEADFATRTAPSRAGQLRQSWVRQRESIGIPPDPRASSSTASTKSWAGRPAPAPADQVVEDDETIEIGDRVLRVLWTPGHTPGHVCFLDEADALVFSGDHLLPHTTPSIALTSVQAGNPLGDYLASLHRVARLPVRLVLPAHEFRYVGIAERAAELIAHHDDRLDQIESILDGHPMASTWDVVNALHWSRPLTEANALLRRTAAQETLAHLVELGCRGRVVAEQDNPVRWRRTGD
jgi:glyoxylase-like metal-dependent hydrolase (beta-lactamase superfamily II)